MGVALHAQRVGLVLSGGGATALSHIGVLKALEENGVPVDYITGSSMGALVGAMYASGISPAEMDSLFQTDLYRLMAYGEVEPEYTYYFKQDREDASMITLGLNVDTTLQMSLPTNLRSPVLIDFEQMRTFAGPSAAAGYNMDSLFVPYRCVASDITARREVVFRQGNLAVAVRASMSYPFYYKPIQVGGHLMMDGGLYNNFPADVMYHDFLPDYIIGSNVAFNAPPPGEDDLMGQLKAIMTQPTNYVLPCDPGTIIEPKTSVSLFDFTSAKQAIADGYAATMARMPKILAEVHRRRTAEELAAARARFRAKCPPLVFGDIRFQGLGKGQALYCERLLNKHNEPITAASLKERYFRLYADNNISGLFPRATFMPQRGNYELDLLVKRERKLEVQFGGLLSSRPVNTGMISARLNLFGRTSSVLEGMAHFGKFYTSGLLRWRTDLSSRKPVFLEPVFTYNRWDYFSGFTSFFQEVRPSYIVQRELWGGVNTGMAMGNKGLLRVDAKWAQSRDSYYQQQDFSAQDTADATEFSYLTTGLSVERNSLNRKQQPNRGELLQVSLRYIGGLERTRPGSLSAWQGDYTGRHDWVILKAVLDKYFLRKGPFRFGFLAEGVYSTQPFFQNYTGTLLQMPVFQPTPESKTYFLENYRAPQYLAGGVRTLVAVARNKFDLRLEGYLFQPYRALEREAGNNPGEGEAVSTRHFLASGSLIYQTPLGPVWFNTSYLDGLHAPWVWSLNFGYAIFSQRARE
ncbi:MAG: patatin-like phospholipase family protein [Flavobacteriales bacterium]|nr:patatin-like phospholipase family protein [Flavobacteriales bacterium]HRO40749.1 patatin-like phospholipase family protein [Flavobacteriales bacterium]HRP81061.1 patatin-like phospholipase family protein [Flavobacteriales bacterium]